MPQAQFLEIFSSQAIDFWSSFTYYHLTTRATEPNSNTPERKMTKAPNVVEQLANGNWAHWMHILGRYILHSEHTSRGAAEVSAYRSTIHAELYDRGEDKAATATWADVTLKFVAASHNAGRVIMRVAEKPSWCDVTVLDDERKSAFTGRRLYLHKATGELLMATSSRSGTTYHHIVFAGPGNGEFDFATN